MVWEGCGVLERSNVGIGLVIGENRWQAFHHASSPESLCPITGRRAGQGHERHSLLHLRIVNLVVLYFLQALEKFLLHSITP